MIYFLKVKFKEFHSNIEKKKKIKILEQEEIKAHSQMAHDQREEENEERLDE